MDYKKDLGRIKARGMLKLNGFYASLLMSIKSEFSSDESITAYTDGLSITIGEVFWDSLNDKQKLFLLLHEINHIILKHPLRASLLKFEEVNFKLWNAACDFFINLMLMDDNNLDAYEFIDGGCLNEEYRDMGTEEIYQILKKEGGTPPSGGIGSDIKVSKVTGSSEAKVVVDSLVKTAISNNKGTYSSNNSFTNQLKTYFEPSQVNWRVLLSQYMHVMFKASKSYAKPNRRTAWNKKLILKAPKTETKLGDLLVYMDVSGSCSDEDIIDMFSELHHIMSKYKPDSIVFSTFNTSIQETFVIKGVDDIPPNLEVSGGTEIQCVIDHIDKHPNKVCLSVLMSDMWSDEFTKPKNTPLLMLVVNNPEYKSNIGEVIYYKKDKI